MAPLLTTLAPLLTKKHLILSVRLTYAVRVTDKKGAFVVMAADKKLSIRDLKRDFKPDYNPLVEPQTVEAKKRLVRAGKSKDLVDPETGEVNAVSAIHTVEWRDDEGFVKVFSAGIAESYGLSRTGQRVFQAILQEYESTKMTGGYADSVYLPWFGDGLNGKAIGMSERTFNRGMLELIERKFLAAKSPEAYWVNPALFFKGDRVAFIREYRRKKISADQKEREDLEKKEGQQRLPDFE